MAGNVFEWCWDWYPSGSAAYAGGTDPHGAETGSSRVLRGGFWNFGASYARCAYRFHYPPNYADAYNELGFRAVLTPSQ